MEQKKIIITVFNLNAVQFFRLYLNYTTNYSTKNIFFSIEF